MRLRVHGSYLWAVDHLQKLPTTVFRIPLWTATWFIFIFIFSINSAGKKTIFSIVNSVNNVRIQYFSSFFFPLKIFLIESNTFLYMKNKTQEIVNLDQKRGGVEEDLR